jgi:hypothetical protein
MSPEQTNTRGERTYGLHDVRLSLTNDQPHPDRRADQNDGRDRQTAHGATKA